MNATIVSQHFGCTRKTIDTLERPYELAPGQRYCPCQLYAPARVKNMAAPTRLHKVSTKS